jgi:hypothetical protein
VKYLISNNYEYNCYTFWNIKYFFPVTVLRFRRTRQWDNIWIWPHNVHNSTISIDYVSAHVLTGWVCEDCLRCACVGHQLNRENDLPEKVRVGYITYSIWDCASAVILFQKNAYIINHTFDMMTHAIIHISAITKYWNLITKIDISKLTNFWQIGIRSRKIQDNCHMLSCTLFNPQMS